MRQLGEAQGTFTMPRWATAGRENEKAFEFDAEGKASKAGKANDPSFWYGNGKHPGRFQHAALQQVEVPAANVLMDAKTRRCMFQAIKIADRMQSAMLGSRGIAGRPGAG